MHQEAIIKVAIVEDEVPAINRLCSMLAEVRPEIHVDVVAKTGKEAILLCAEKEPDLIFLDIHLPDMKGFEVIEALPYTPYVVFTTAYAQYAIRAFETWAVDYLLKPFDQDQLIQSINKYISIITSGKVPPDINWNDLQSLFYVEKSRTSFTVKNGDRLRLVDYKNIAYFTAEDKYTKVHLLRGRSLFCDSSLKEIELNLNDSFLRVHRSIIINIAAISEIKKVIKGRFVFYFDSNNVGSIRSGASYRDAIVQKLNL